MSTKVGARSQQIWRDNIEKEEKLRLKWFRKNEKLLVEEAEKPLNADFVESVENERMENRKHLFQDSKKFPMTVKDEAPLLDYDPDCTLHIMRPVDPKTRNLLYTGTQKDGRINYLHEREKIIPEKKYYFPETTSFRYGWKMWDHAKTNQEPRYGKSSIIKQSFYRRRGVERDPEWYQVPSNLSPTVCDCN